MSAARRVAVHEMEADLVVEEREDVTEGVVALTLADPSGGELPAWTLGAPTNPGNCSDLTTYPDRLYDTPEDTLPILKYAAS